MGSTNPTRQSVLVTGATGRQGGAVARHLLAHQIPVTVLTRDPESPAARALAEAGGRLLQGDFDDLQSLKRALKGVSAVFAMQTPYESGVSQEVVQGVRLANAAHAAGVEQIVYTSVASADTATGVPHFESKGEIERHIVNLKFRSMTILRPVFFMEMLLSPGNLRTLADNRIALCLRPTTKVAMIAVDDIARMAMAAFLDPNRWNGAAITLAGDVTDFQDVASAFGDALGRPVSYAQIPPEALNPDTRPKAGTQKWLEEAGWTVDLNALREAYPFRPRTLRQWAVENAAALSGAG